MADASASATPSVPSGPGLQFPGVCDSVCVNVEGGALDGRLCVCLGVCVWVCHPQGQLRVSAVATQAAKTLYAALCLCCFLCPHSSQQRECVCL